MKLRASDVRDAAQIVLGCAIYGMSFSFLTYPNNIVAGGLTGIAQISNLLTGLPVGVQLVCGGFEEEKLLRIAKAFEDLAAPEVRGRRPNL